VARRARHLLALPVDLEALRVDAFVGARLLVAVDSRRAAQVDIVVPVALSEKGGVEEAGVDDMDARQEILIRVSFPIKRFVLPQRIRRAEPPHRLAL